MVERSFLLIANRAVPTSELPLEDLPGAGGRFDLVARFVTASLLTSHGIREDAAALVLFTKPEEPLAVRIHGDAAIGLRPDERSTAAKLAGVLEATPMPVWQEISDGIELRAVGLEELVAELTRPLHLLAEDGDPLHEDPPSGGSFVLGDQDELREEQRRTVAKAADRTISVGPVPLQADQVVTVVQNVLDRSTR